MAASTPSKEKFKEIILTLLQTKNHNCISLSNSQYAEIVKTLKRVKESGPKCCKDYYRKNRFHLQLVNGEERLMKSGTNLEFVSTDDLFDVIHQAHLMTNHGRRGTMVKLLATKYANITQEQVMVYLKLCNDCRVSQKSKVWKGFNLTPVQSPVSITENPVKCEVDPLAVQLIEDQRPMYKGLVSRRENHNHIDDRPELQQRSNVSALKRNVSRHLDHTYTANDEVIKPADTANTCDIKPEPNDNQTHPVEVPPVFDGSFYLGGIEFDSTNFNYFKTELPEEEIAAEAIKFEQAPSTSASPPPGSSPTANSLLAGTNIPLPTAGVVNEDVPILVMPPPPKEPQQYDSKKTKEATKYSAKIFRDFCHSRGINTAIEDMAKSELDELLTDFYINVRTQGGQFYSFSSLVALRHGLNRYLKNVNIVNDPAFRKSNLSFKVALKRLKEAGKGSIEHKEPISQADMATLYSHSQVFNPNTPEGLLNKVWFEITFYFFRRGQENQRYLTPNHFGFATDEYGRKYVYKRKSLSLYTNGCNMDPTTSSSDSGRGVRMYATGNAVCPVATFERYLRKRNPHESALFQHPRTTSFQDSIWYNASPLGKEALSTMMKRIALTAKLSRVYTNHCIRATAKFVLFQVFDAFQQFDPQQGSSSGSIGAQSHAQSLAMSGINTIPGLNTLTSHDLTGAHDAGAAGANIAGTLNYGAHPSGLRVAMVQADADNGFISAAHLPNLSEIALNRQEAMEVQSAVAAATANIISQPHIESYDPGPEQSLQNSKMRGCTDKDLSVSFSASSRPVTVFKKTYVDPEHADGMMKSLASLWRKRRLCDAKICSGDKNVTLHRLVLFAASPHLMEKNITDGADLEVNLPPGISEDGLKIFVSFLYDGVLNLNEHLYKDVERISNLLKVDKIQKHCREFSASLNEHRQMSSSPSMSTPRRRDNIPKSQKSSNRQTVVLTLSDDSNPPETSLSQQHPQEHTLTLSHSQIEDLQNNLDERIQALNEHHAYMTSHHDRYPPVTQTSGISLQTAVNTPSTITAESGIKTEPIEILDDDITDYGPSQDSLKPSKRSLNSSKSYAGESPGSETIRRSTQNHPSSTVTRTYLTTSKCESGLEMTEMDGITTSCASSGTSPYPVSLVASSGETFPLYTLSSNQS